MKESIKIISIIIITVIILLLLGLGIKAIQVGSLKFWAPIEQNIRREVFTGTQSYNEAKLQELTKYRLEYLKSKDEEVKAAIASTIMHQFASCDTNKLPYELENFLREIQKN